ncbi:GH3 auxin-responsive promoter family protein [Candidatus Ozemobacteraceae bacterium]|nr:GH3 auxin-responsive promoter family protein [Candidatus Ozemobacteraceae bacterium]
MSGIVRRLGLVAIHGGWLAACLPGAMAFSRASRQPVKRTQEFILKSILQANAGTAYGHRFGFGRIHSPEAFQERVPPVDFDDLAPWIERAAAGEPGVLSADPVRLFEPTSGSSAATKLIPYTCGLQEAFNRALHPWLVDLFLHHPDLTAGPAYWVVTPRSGQQARTSGGIPIGFQDDAEYFGPWGKRFVDTLMAVPSQVIRDGDSGSWRFQTLLHLLSAGDLRLVSLWNPTFLPSLLRELAPLGDRLVGALASEVPDRAGLLRDLLPALRGGREDGLGTRLWPALRLISTWTEAEAAGGIPALRRWFPDVALETKGLLATEGVVTIPRIGAPAQVLAVRSGFFEFQEGEEGETPCRTAEALEPGGRYRVLLTTPGGLYRYRLHDIVEMKGWWRELPSLAFCGKEALISDLCGEKLNARHVAGILARLVNPDTRCFLAAERGASPHYCLFLPANEHIYNNKNISVLLEEALCENFHYRWCREAGQLGAVTTVNLPFDGAELDRRRLARLEAEGTRQGTAKLAPLDRQPGWKGYLLT